MNKNDPNYIAKLEHIVSEKYGEDSVIPPQANWTEDKEKEYLEQIKLISSQEENQQEEIIENDGFIIEKKLFNKSNSKYCPLCNIYTKYIQDDLYLTKYNMCYRCFLLNEGQIKRNKENEINQRTLEQNHKRGNRKSGNAGDE